MAMIEANWRPDRKQLSGFGWIGLVAFAALATWSYWKHRVLWLDLAPDTATTVAIALWCVAGACGVLAIVAPRALWPLYVAMMTVALPIGFVVSHVVMVVMFFGIFTPVALVFRLIGRDAMCRRLEPDAPTYWTPRTPVTDVTRYFRQF